jgi:hypothetical protein
MFVICYCDPNASANRRNFNDYLKSIRWHSDPLISLYDT